MRASMSSTSAKACERPMTEPNLGPTTQPLPSADSAGPTTQPLPAPILQLRGVTRSVRLPNDSILDILTGVDLDVFPSEHVGIVGRSGTGKSTLLNILGLLDRPSSGEMHFAGTEVSRISQRKAAGLRGRDIGFVFQQFNLLPGRTALENVEAPLLYGTPAEFWQRRKLATEALERLGLGHRLNQLPISLSGGEQQRVAIARAIVRSPRVLLADEPTGALDVDTGRSVMRLLEEITAEGDCSLITITHDPAIAAMAGRRFQLADGRLHALEASTAAEVAAHLGAGADLETGSHLPGGAR